MEAIGQIHVLVVLIQR